jgi:2-octaprenyl-6-methoxyphenol hydroxylase
MGSTKRYDAVIAGGGLNGLAAAVALGGPEVRMPLDVCIVDAADPKMFRAPKFDGRASAITASSRRMLDLLGIWDAVADKAQPMRDIVVTDSQTGAAERPALLHFGEEHAPGVVSAHMIENQHLYAALYDMDERSAAIDIKAGTVIEGFTFATGTASVSIAGGEALQTGLVVGADGRNSSARKAAGIDVIGWSYPQSGITFTVEHDRDHDGRAEEHFLPAGPFAILPLTGRRSSIVWTERSGLADDLMAMDDDAFMAEFRTRFGDRLGEARMVSKRFCYPLSLQIAQRFAGDRLALIGDAAHVVHPIAGLGFNLGLRDIAALAEAVGDAVRLGLDPGAADVLERYQAWRRLDTVMVAAATDGINRLFSNDNPALRSIRDMGLGMVNQMSGLKSVFMREAAGLSGQLPKLLAGEPV